ncbi:NAD(P)-dependent glycerol-3-phosphate dehydrogenase, partial [Nocardioides mangrovicus]
MSRIAVLPAGSWGTTFSIVLGDAGHDVVLWARRDEVAQAVNARHENPDYLPGIELPPNVSATSDVEKALAGADVVVLAVPSQSLRANLAEWAEAIPREAVLVSLMKGVELGTLDRMSEVIADVTGAGPERIAVVSGPNLAKEIAAREPAASVVACADLDVARRLQDLVHTRAFRPYSTTDVVGCEIGGTYKNVIALCVGMAAGLGFGDNTTASLITRGLAETARLATALGADPLTLMGLAGLGDLVATCSSPLSRNRTFGEKLGQGMGVAEITAELRQTAEGVKSCASIR